MVLFSVSLKQQEHYGLCFPDFVKGFLYKEKHPTTMPGMAYLKLKGSLDTKGNKIKGSAPTLFDMRNVHCLADNPNNILSPYHLYDLMHQFMYPDEEFICCYKGNHELLDQYSSLLDCRGFQMNPTCRVRKNYE
jgi:hypothetical protein